MSLLIALASGGIGAVVAGIFQLINRHLDNKEANIKGQLQKLEKDKIKGMLTKQ